MDKSKKTKKQGRGASCLGALLIFCMILLAGLTVCANLVARGDKAIKLGGYTCYYYTGDEMTSKISKNNFLFFTEPDMVKQGNIVLYNSTAGNKKIGNVSLVLLSPVMSSQNDELVYHLTNEKSLESVAVMHNDIIGILKGQNKKIGIAMGVMSSKSGILVGLILPCLVLLLYILNLISESRDAADEDDDDDTDLAFVKSIQQKKLQQTAEFAKVNPEAAQLAEKEAASRKKLSKADLEALEEKEAAERAERIAAIRTRMENRKPTEMPDNVPLFTTEFIAKTHTMQIPKNATASAVANSTAKQAEEQAKKRAESLKKKEDERILESVMKQAAAAKEAAEGKVTEQAAETAAEVKKPAAPKKKKSTKPKQTVASASYDDLMAFLNAEESKLDK